MSIQERNQISTMSHDRRPTKPFFGKKQAHYLSTVIDMHRRGAKGTLFQLTEEGQEAFKPVEIEEVLVPEEGGAYIKLKTDDGKTVWKAQESLGLAPHADGTWMASEFLLVKPVK